MAPRRNRLLFIVVLITVVGILYLTSSSRAVGSHDFYTRTRSRLETDGSSASGKEKEESSLDKITPQRATSGDDEDDKVAAEMSRRLLDAEVAAKERANEKAPTRESVMGDDGGSTGDKDRGKLRGEGEQKPVVKDIVKDAKGRGDRNVAGRKKYPIGEEKGVAKEEVDGSDEAVTAELNSILKMAPSSSPLPFYLPPKPPSSSNAQKQNHKLTKTPAAQ
ncbi:hypothetical protein V494_04596 [Pseudogymnoascus sp. VKM F-4513 (FW-928)]|nr:hypothetical protein V494_04596 [Pseudogymnoascus sp. VKM F-4513 (FW-928)]